MSNNNLLPGPGALLAARDWLLSGCPVIKKNPFTGKASTEQAEESIKTLIQLLNALPTYIEEYSYGTKAYYSAMEAEYRNKKSSF